MTVVNQDQFEVVKDVSFSVRGGEIFAIAGVAGTGRLSWRMPLQDCFPSIRGRYGLMERILQGNPSVKEVWKGYPISRRTGRITGW